MACLDFRIKETQIKKLQIMTKLPWLEPRYMHDLNNTMIDKQNKEAMI